QTCALPSSEGVDVRAQVPVPLDEAVLEAVRRDQLDVAVVDHAEHHPARGRTQIARRDGQLPVEPVHGAHRRNAAATPASTGTCRPVVWERSPAVSANTALATFAGSTSRLSRVRWA